jgi:hypothetical protein
MDAVREILSRPLAAAAMCALLTLPARLPGDEAARAFRRLIDLAISRSDLVFGLVTRSDLAYAVARHGQAWGAWIVYGLVTGLIAMGATRLLAGRAQAWSVVALVLGVWALVRLVWNWDLALQFALTPVLPGGPPARYGPWPYAGSLGYLAGFALGLVLAAAPWRASNSLAAPAAGPNHSKP